ncbi:MAG: Uma2 family endonuclease, partial [Chitinophagaceae bacterium]
MENEVKEAVFKYNYITPQEYLLAERASEEKHEYYDGQVLAMSGARLNHNSISMNLFISIGHFLKGKNCRILPADMRVSTPSHDTYMYPDGLIVCGESKLEDDKFDTLLNPAVIFEILSPSTRGIDKGRKLFFYQQIPSLLEYIMIDSQKRFIQLARKQDNGGWTFENNSDAGSSLFIRTIDFSLSMDEIYTHTGL